MAAAKVLATCGAGCVPFYRGYGFQGPECWPFGENGKRRLQGEEGCLCKLLQVWWITSNAFLTLLLYSCGLWRSLITVTVPVPLPGLL